MNNLSQKPLINFKESEPNKNLFKDGFCGLAENSIDERYLKGHQLYSPYESERKVYILKEGQVILYHSDDGKREIFDTLEPGSIFGAFSVDHSQNHFAEVTRASRLCITPTEDFLKIIIAYPDAFPQLLSKLMNRIEDYSGKIQSCSVSAIDRVYRELVRLHKKRLPMLIDAPLQVTHEQIAERTNLNRVTVTRMLAVLCKQGLIEIENGIRIINLNS